MWEEGQQASGWESQVTEAWLGCGRDPTLQGSPAPTSFRSLRISCLYLPGVGRTRGRVTCLAAPPPPPASPCSPIPPAQVLVHILLQLGKLALCHCSPGQQLRPLTLQLCLVGAGAVSQDKVW